MAFGFSASDGTSATGVISAHTITNFSQPAGSIIVSYHLWQNTNALTISDNKSNTWTPVFPRLSLVGGFAGWSFQCFVVLTPVVSGLDTAVTVDPGGSVFNFANFLGYTGFVLTPSIGPNPVSSAQQTGAGATRSVTSSIATDVANAILLTVTAPQHGTSASVLPFNSPWTNRTGIGGDANWVNGGYADQFVSALQSGVTSTYNLAGDDADGSALFAIEDGLPAGPHQDHGIGFSGLSMGVQGG